MTEARTTKRMAQVELQAHEWRARLDAGLSEAEEREFNQWIIVDEAHGAELARAEIGWSLLGEFDLPSALTQTEIELEPVAEERPSLGDLIRQSWAAFGGQLSAGALTVAALIAAFFISGGPSLLTDQTSAAGETYITDARQTKRLELPDRSTLVLGPKSELSLSLTDTARSATLSDGSAFFDVRSDSKRPFLVTTAVGAVRVTGTQFDVRLNNGVMDVAVGEGSVEVTLPGASNAGGKQGLRLTAGESVQITDAGFGEIMEFYPAEFAAWRSGRLVYLRAPLSTVIADLNRYSEVPISVSERAGKIALSGTFNASNVDRLLTRLDEQLAVRIERRDDGIRVLAD